jgi:hypothetical protein
VADDIVTRLRSTSLFPEWSDLAPDYGIGDDGEKLSVFVYGEQLLNKAADEIERLRAQLEESRQDHLATFLELMEERCG